MKQFKTPQYKSLQGREATYYGEDCKIEIHKEYDNMCYIVFKKRHNYKFTTHIEYEDNGIVVKVNDLKLK